MQAATPPLASEGWQDTAAQALALVVERVPAASAHQASLARLLQASRAVRAALQRSRGHARMSLVMPDGADSSELAFSIACARHERRLLAFAAWLPQHASLVRSLDVELADGDGSDALIAAFQRCAAAAAQAATAAAPAAGAAPAAPAAPAPATPAARAGPVTRRAAAAAAVRARLQPMGAAMPLRLRSLGVQFSLPSVQLLTALPGSSLQRLELHLAGPEFSDAGLVSALPQLGGLRSLSLRSVAALDVVGGLAALTALRRLDWAGVDSTAAGAVLAQLPTSVAALQLDLDVEGSTHPCAWDEEPQKDDDVALDCSRLVNLRSLDVKATLWDDDGHCLWQGDLQPTLPPGLTRLVMTGRADDIRGPTSTLQELSLTEWWFGPERLTEIITSAAPALRSLHLTMYVPDNFRDYHQHEEQLSLEEFGALAAAIGAASHLTRLALELAGHWVALDGSTPNPEHVGAKFAAVLPGLAGSLEVLSLGHPIELAAAHAGCLSSLTGLRVLHVSSPGIDTPAFVALCGSLTRLEDLHIQSSSIAGPAAPVFSAAAALTGLTRLQLGTRADYALKMSARDLGLLQPLQGLRWLSLPPSIGKVPSSAVASFAARMPHLDGRFVTDAMASISYTVYEYSMHEHDAQGGSSDEDEDGG